MKIVDDWRHVLKRAWSVRLMVFGSVLTAGSVSLPFLAPIVPLKYLVAYVVLVFVVNIGAIASRFISQEQMGECIDADRDE